jgi:hypothetical protein
MASRTWNMAVTSLATSGSLKSSKAEFGLAVAMRWVHFKIPTAASFQISIGSDAAQRLVPLSELAWGGSLALNGRGVSRDMFA